MRTSIHPALALAATLAAGGLFGGCASNDAPVTGAATAPVANDANIPPEAKARANAALDQARAQGEAMKKAQGR